MNKQQILRRVKLKVQYDHQMAPTEKELSRYKLKRFIFYDFLISLIFQTSSIPKDKNAGNNEEESEDKSPQNKEFQLTPNQIAKKFNINNFSKLSKQEQSSEHRAKDDPSVPKRRVCYFQLLFSH